MTLTKPVAEHPFAHFVRILGKGKSGTRALSPEEAEEAFSMVLQGTAEPVQVGAFLMLLRVKEETGEELAGFVNAVRSHMEPAPAALLADLDWSSYAGKKNQHPWFILSIMLLTQAGYRIFIHGARGHTADRLYTQDALAALQLPVASNWAEVGKQLDKEGLSYLPLEQLCPALEQLIQLRPLLGLRSPVHTLTRMLNPLRAEASIQSVFHPAYADLHQQADLILQQPRALVFKGEGGEVEVKPQADTRLKLLSGADCSEIVLERHLNGRVANVEIPNVKPLQTLWRAEQENDYGYRAVIATTAAALTVLDAGTTIEAAHGTATALWQQRDLSRLPLCH